MLIVHSIINILSLSYVVVKGDKVQFPASLPAFVYEGRWLHQDGSAKTDWPCASLRFSVQVGQAGGTISIVWKTLRSRVNATIEDVHGKFVSWSLFKGPETCLFCSSDGMESHWKLSLPVNRAGRHVVSLRKLTTAAPFGMGIATKFLSPSSVTFLGLGPLTGSVTLEASLERRGRRMEFVGASDTAGFCVDGTPDTSPLEWGGNGWAYENCPQAYAGRVGDAFNAETFVEAISGIGMTQNAAASQTWQLGPLPMPGYFRRALQTEQDSAWNFSAWTPNVLLIDLGGNDYNHQNGHVPSNSTFTAAYEEFLDRVFSFYREQPTVIAVCGMGSPLEAKQEPDNNRCRPCPHVEHAINAYSTKGKTSALHYIFVPCDGTVATGDGDIGCNGHKNRIGQAEVASFLIPRIAKIMHWSWEDNEVSV